MELFFDEADETRAGGAKRLTLLEELGARPLSAAGEEASGFVFSMSPSLDDYRRLIAGRAHLEEQPGDYGPLLDWRILGDRIAATRRVAVLRCRTAPTRYPMDWPGLTILRASRTLLASAPRIIAPSEDAQRGLESARGELGEDLQIVVPPDDFSLGACPTPLRVWVYEGRPVAESIESWEDESRPAMKPEFSPRAQEQAAKLSVELARAWDCLTLAVDWMASPRGLLIYDAGSWSRATSLHFDLLRAVFGLLSGRAGSACSGRGWRALA